MTSLFLGESSLPPLLVNTDHTANVVTMTVTIVSSLSTTRKLLLLILSAVVLASGDSSFPGPAPLGPYPSKSPPSPRPSLSFSPYGPNDAFPPSPPRSKVCYVDSHNDLVHDDSQYVLDALHSCNNGGHVIFNKDTNYLVGTALDMTFLLHIDIDIQGYILFTNDSDYWQANAFNQTFQNATTFFQLGGEDVNVFGSGTLDGNGQVWYDLYAKDIYILRPVLFGTIGLKSGSISNLNLIYSPQYYNFVANSSNVVFQDIFISGFSKSNNTAKNTDGWDTYRSDNIVIQNSIINNGDGKALPLASTSHPT